MIIQPKCKRGKLSKVLKTFGTFYKSLFGLNMEICLNVKVQLSCKAFLFAFGDIIAHSPELRS